MELWFSEIERDLAYRGNFTSVPVLARRIVRCIRRHNDAAKPVKCQNEDPSRGIRVAQGLPVPLACRISWS